MKLALKELRRRPGRFATATVILTLIAVLLMFLGSLLDGLIASSTGAIRAQDADAIVYSASAQASFQRSRIEPDIRSAVESVDGVDEVGGLGVVQLGARVPGNGPRDLANVALFGYELAPDGVPEPPADGEAYADEVLKADGVEEGMTIEIGPARTPVDVIGFVSDTSFNGQGGLWASEATWRSTLAENRPDAQLADGVWQALVVRGDVEPGAIDSATDGATDSYTVDGAVNAIPGVSEQQGTFNQIIGVTIAVALVVIGLFFALITVERVGLYGVLKALGAKSSTIFGGLLVQAVVVTLIAASVAGALVVLLDVVIPPGSIPIAVSIGSIVSSAALLLLAAVIGCSFSLRRVLKVDPASAIG
ncbi:ABC transporter permease [Ilumatobacter nonamiensis]|uniref:ABC transporter permease n=1 Tax=Ilumatobacter nonamiensis TaxID=467093 RepID=UPI00034A7CC3|nr:ABC transporter permease [Ilumatobacter nonamiensis]